jgi:hypothetical protein
MNLPKTKIEVSLKEFQIQVCKHEWKDAMKIADAKHKMYLELKGDFYKVNRRVALWQ